MLISLRLEQYKDVIIYLKETQLINPKGLDIFAVRTIKSYILNREHA